MPTGEEDKLRFMQNDGTEIHVIGLSVKNIQYTETLDGYTLAYNKNGIYEYAKLSSKGKLKPSGLKAKNKEDRGLNQKLRLLFVKKHLRYQPPHLEERLEKSLTPRERIEYHNRKKLRK